MKNILMSTAALAGLALVAAAPARADEPALQLGLGGYISGYAVYTDQDDAAGASTRNFDFRKDTEVHLNGEVALDNGITAGAHLELLADRADGGQTVEESYLYLSSSWGRINMGEEDGAAYLLQVGAPSADDKVDGIRPDITTINPVAGGYVDYAADDFGYSNKLTYITPVFNGFQAAASFTPSIEPSNAATNAGFTLGNLAVAGDGPNGGFAGANGDNTAGHFENGMEIAARYEGPSMQSISHWVVVTQRLRPKLMQLLVQSVLTICKPGTSALTSVGAHSASALLTFRRTTVSTRTATRTSSLVALTTRWALTNWAFPT